MELNVTLAILGALILCGLAANIWFSTRRAGAPDNNAALASELAVSRVHADRVPGLEAALDAAQQRLAGMEAQFAARNATLAAQEADRDDLRRRLAAAEMGLRAKVDLEVAHAALRETLAQERRQFAERPALEDLLTKEFKLAAGTIMQQHGEAFTKQNKDQIDIVLTPLREKLVEFQQGLTNAHTESAKDRATLAEQIKNLAAKSDLMTNETSNLTRALKGKSQTQGAWGEMILATILENSGLRQGEEYEAQASHTTEDGQRLRPDVVVKLPENHRIVIDAKVSLTAYEAHSSAENDDERTVALRAHLISLRNHIKILSSKEYHAHTPGSVDYVIMFVPIEGALAIALQADPALIIDALAQHITIATPTTLITVLRTVRSIWRTWSINKNAEEIAVRAGQLYEKFVGFTDDMEKLGGKLGDAQASHKSAMNKLSTGTGNVFRQFEMLKTLGAKTNKTLPAGLLDIEPVLTIAPEV
jgi:DNA recombination protein RmuC